MCLATKISAFYLGASLLLVVALAAIALIAFRYFSLTAAENHARTAAEIVRVHLTESMLLGTIGERQRFLERLREVPNLKRAVVIRSPLVDQQFGKNRKGEAEPDEIEQQVLATGRPFFTLIENLAQSEFRATIPYVATTRGTPNCLTCHQVAEGSVLGAITVQIGLEALRLQAVVTVAGIVLAIAGFSVFLLWWLHILLRPVTVTAEEIAAVVHEGVEGRFERRILTRSRDEMGWISEEINRLLGAIEGSLSEIGQQIAMVTRWRARERNQLKGAVEAVSTMAAVAHFKQAIEEDRTTAEIYQRIYRLSETGFNVTEMALLEVKDKGVIPIAADGTTPLSCCSACDPGIAEEPLRCRAIRTGHVVDGVTDPTLCEAQRVTTTRPEAGYLCFPILFSGKVGVVVQWIVSHRAPEEWQRAAERFQLYLDEAAPVLETKHLMAKLKENTIRDPLTGLHNRRFLEESIDALTAQTLRRSSHLAVLMADIDYFKMVNDTYGHDAGDKVIQHVASILKGRTRSCDWIFRYGGEEFLLILPDCTAQEAIIVAERIRQAMEAQPVVLPDGTEITKTLSIGVADFPEDATGFWQVVKFADIALYHAKETGRNQVVRFTPALWTDQSKY